MIRINLLPPEYRAQPSINPMRVLILLVGVVLVLGVLGGGLYFYLDLQALSSEVEAIRQERLQYGALYEKVIGMEKTLDEVNKQIASHEQLVGRHLETLDILGALCNAVPESVKLDNISIKNDRAIAITGTAADYYGVAAFHLKLNLSDNFAPGVLGNAAYSGNAVSFSLTTAYRKSNTGTGGTTLNPSPPGAQTGRPGPAGVSAPPASSGSGRSQSPPAATGNPDGEVAE